MIVQEPPYDLIALFSDLEMQKLFEAWIERGQEGGRRCAREFRWRSLRDPRRDTVWSQPDRVLVPFFRFDCRFLIVWDHHGTGVERLHPSEVEVQVVQQLERVGVDPSRVMAVALVPELERLLVPVWSKVKAIIGDERAIEPPEDDAILAEIRKFSRLKEEIDFNSYLPRHPKEAFEALVRIARLRRSAPLYERIGGSTSLPAVKKDETAMRIASAIAEWFPRLPAASQANRT